ncbi:LysM peptidoglycan-binding domain-containing M23 family metallopeptidase [Lachnospiraceae bacterium OttesenSCG-928-E19]|nr:LysM peptidoglycan-binding domain-containing M23 family metallopeptidase [Lachnospiraceae bacterium OttesenSCG-928-E19]
MKKILGLFCALVIMTLSACDLQPKITSLPDTVGEFIAARYPAMLADPETQPEIYNSAVTDYGVYASPELYGSSASTDDYILYASIDDYTLKPTTVTKQSVTDVSAGEPLVLTGAVSDDFLTVPMYGSIERKESTVVVARGDTLYSLSRRYRMSVDEMAELNNLNAPYNLAVGQKLKVSTVHEATVEVPVITTKVELGEMTVAAGDTLYSISRKYEIPVNDLAVMNKLSVPFTLKVGQKLRVPKMQVVANNTTVPVRTGATPTNTSTVSVPKTPSVTAPVKTTAPPKTATSPKTPTTTTTTKPPAQKISSNPDQKLPTIAKRSSSKFSWPVRGTILSSYGAKSNGLFNDGINISATRGTKVGAAENGVVAYAGNEVKGMGNLVIVQHSDGWMTVYAHMDKLSVRRGVKVTVGQQVGTVGQTGAVNKPQLHFELRKGTKAYDPSAYLKK